MSVQPEMIITHPWRAFRAGPLTIRETVYGIVKRLEFFLKCIEIESKSRQLNPSQVRVLDVGCGTGVNVTIRLAEASYSVVGLDVHAPPIERAQQLAAGLQNIEFRCGALERQCFDQDFHSDMFGSIRTHAKALQTLGSDIQRKPRTEFLYRILKSFGQEPLSHQYDGA